MQLLRKRKQEDRALTFHGAVREPWAQRLGLNYKNTETGDGSLSLADVWGCVRCLSDSVASVPLIAYRATDTGRVRLSSGRLPGLLSRPAPAMTQGNLTGLMMAHLALWGNAYLGKFRGEDGRVEQLGMLHPERVTVELRAGMPLYTVTDGEGHESLHGVEDITHIKGLSLDGLTGLSPIKQCRLALATSEGLAAHNEAFFRNGARPSGILKVPSGAMNEEHVRQLEETLRSRHAGAANAHRIAIISGDADWVSLGGPLDDMEFVEQRRLSTAEICRVFKVPAWMVNATAGSDMTYSNSETHMLAFVMHSLRPWCVAIEQAISNDPDLCGGNAYVEFLLDALLRADSATRAQVYTAALNAETGWLTRAEVRRLENLPPESEDV